MLIACLMLCAKGCRTSFITVHPLPIVAWIQGDTFCLLVASVDVAWWLVFDTFCCLVACVNIAWWHVGMLIPGDNFVGCSGKLNSMFCAKRFFRQNLLDTFS